jgi:hypothetical protein
MNNEVEHSNKNVYLTLNVKKDIKKNLSSISLEFLEYMKKTEKSFGPIG